jgi:hypothetical protein
MAMEGKIKDRNGKLYVLYATTLSDEPIRHYIWWRVIESYSNKYNAYRPEDGDTATYSHSGSWNTHNRNGSTGRVVTGDGKAQAELVETTVVEPPKTRGKELRWNNGRWEKLMASGWVPTGEGTKSTVAKTKANAP